MTKVGYARVSSFGQSFDTQLSKLTEFGCSKIYSEKASGVDSSRPELGKCLDYVREGDELVITKLDRLARSTLDLHRILKKLEELGVLFKVLDQNIDTGTKEGKLMFSILASITEFETELRAERQREGIDRAKELGVRFGRKAKLSPDQVAEMKSKRQQGVLIKDLMAEYSLSKASVYRLLS